MRRLTENEQQRVQLAAFKRAHQAAQQEISAIDDINRDVDQIVIQVGRIAEAAGVDMRDIAHAADYVEEAFSGLVKSLHDLQEVFQDHITTLELRMEDDDIDLDEAQQPDVSYVIKVLHPNSSTRFVKQYLVTDLRDWCQRKGVDFQAALDAVHRQGLVKGTATNYRVTRYKGGTR